MSEASGNRWAEVAPVIDHGVRALCRKPYPNHPRGCPNYGKRATCPPYVRCLDDVLNLQYPCYAIWNRFDLAAHRERMRQKHPQWTRRQLDCCLYWQGTARKQLRETITRFQYATAGRWKILRVPEACGVNVTATMARIGIALEWPPDQYAYQVALAGYPRDARADDE